MKIYTKTVFIVLALILFVILTLSACKTITLYRRNQNSIQLIILIRYILLPKKENTQRKKSLYNIKLLIIPIPFFLKAKKILYY